MSESDTISPRDGHDNAPASAPTIPPAQAAAALARMQGAVELWTGDWIYARPIRPDDTARLQAFHSRLSSDSILFRHFRYLPTLSDPDADHFTHVDYNTRMALIAMQDSSPDAPLIGVVRYDQISPAAAEVAFVVEDRWQGHGIATALLRWLAPYARMRGITRFVAITLASNAKMLEVLHRAGYPSSSRYADGEYEVTLDISAPSPDEPSIADSAP